MKKVFSLISTLIMTTSAVGFTGNNDPRFIVSNYRSHFQELPLSAKLADDQIPWSSSFWPHIYGGIAFRWNGYYSTAPHIMALQHEISELKKEITQFKKDLFQAINPSPYDVQTVEKKISENNKKISSLLNTKGAEHQKYFFNINRPQTLQQVRLMSQDMRDMLSPAEKFDIYVALKTDSELSNSLTNNVLNLTGPFKAYWEGICHGWSSAAIEFAEPKIQTFTKNGITLNFGSSDFKALLSYYHASITRNPTTAKKSITSRVGERCSVEFPKEAWHIKNGKEYYKTIEHGKVVTKLVPADCIDTNPGAFHIVLANQIALNNQGFVAEIVRDNEVWNQPVFGYESEVLSTTTNIDPYATDKTSKQMRVKTRMHYANDGGRMFWEQEDPEEEFYAWWKPTNGTTNYRNAYKDFEYILDLDKRGQIIGGRWLSYERPDFLWLKKSKGFITSGLFLGIVGYMKHLQDFVSIRE